MISNGHPVLGTREIYIYIYIYHIPLVKIPLVNLFWIISSLINIDWRLLSVYSGDTLLLFNIFLLLMSMGALVVLP